jgi:hypothetical protein
MVYGAMPGNYLPESSLPGKCEDQKEGLPSKFRTEALLNWRQPLRRRSQERPMGRKLRAIWNGR